MLPVLALTLVGVVRPARASEADRIEYLNKKAMEDYDSLEFDSARRTLTDCVAKLRATGQDQTPLAAKTYTHLGIVYVAGLHDKSRGQKQFEKALAIDPTLRLDPTLATPELQESWDAVVASLPRKKRQAAEQAAKQEAPVPTATASKNPPEPPSSNTEPGSDALRHTPVDDVPPGQRIAIYAHPNVPIARATLFYRAPGQERYSEVAMGRSRKIAGDIVGYIPADAVSGRSLQYYLETYGPAGGVIGKQGSPESPFVVSVVGGKASSAGTAGEEEDPLAQVRKDQAAERAPKPFREHVYFDIALGTGGAVVPSGTTTEIAYYYTSKPMPQYQPARASSGGFVWSGLALRGEIGGYIYQGLTLGMSHRIEVFLNNNADSTGTPRVCTGMSPCYATTSKVNFGYIGLVKLRYQFNRKSMFRPYVHFDIGGGFWRGGLNIEGSKPMANGAPDPTSVFQPTDACSANYNGMTDSTRDPEGCSSVGRIKGYNLQDPKSMTPNLNRVCPGEGTCVDSVLLGYGMVGGGGGFYLGGEHFGVTVDLTLLGAFGGGQSALLIDTYIGPQFIF